MSRLTTVVMARNAVDPSTWTNHEVEDVCAFLLEEMGSWPATARIYDGHVAQVCDVTPRCAEDVAALREAEGPLFVVVYPEGPVAIIVAVVAVAAIAAAAFLLMPKVPNVAKNQQAGSSNNELGERTNKPRLNGRIPDIFGQVRSVPDMLAVPYRVFDNHKELEISFMCIGRGSYLVEDVRDGDTLAADIEGASVAVYAPYTSPNVETDVPQLQIGTPISDPVFNATRMNEVNGQVLRAPNDEAVRSDNEIVFADGGIIKAATGSGIDFTQFFEVGDEVEVGNGDAAGSESATGYLAAATAASAGSFTFATFDPSSAFAAGQRIIISNAVYYGDAGTTGDLDGAVVNPDIPSWKLISQEETL